MEQPGIWVFASGEKEAEKGGSGFKRLVLATESTPPELNAKVVGVVSNYPQGGVFYKAADLGVPFLYLPKFCGPDHLEEQWRKAGEPELICLSGLKKRFEAHPVSVASRRITPRMVINIHPGPLPRFGGHRMFGHYVHEAVMEAFSRGEITHTEICMHFVTWETGTPEDYDRGPVFFRLRIKIREGETAAELAVRVNELEHKWQPAITNLVVHGRITWDGEDPRTLTFPLDYMLTFDETDEVYH